MASVGMNYISAAITEKQEILFYTHDEYFYGDLELKAIKQVKDYFKRYKAYPTHKQFNLDYDGGLFEYWRTQLIQRHSINVYADDIQEINSKIGNQKIEEAKGHLNELLQKLDTGKSEELLDFKTLLDLSYDAAPDRRYKNGQLGVGTPWEGLNKLIKGFRESNSYTFAARPKVGKTQILMMCSDFAHRVGHDVMMLSMEMDKAEYADRFLAYTMGFATEIVMTGQFNSSAYTTLRGEIDQKVRERTNRYIFKEGLFTTSIVDIEEMVSRERPSILFIDGAYLIRLPNSHKFSRWERVAEITERIKLLAGHLTIPVVCSYQFNREGSNDRAGAANVQYSDTIGQITSALIGIFKTDNNLTRKLVVSENRSGMTGEVLINWDWERNNYAEVTSAYSTGEPIIEGEDEVYEIV